MDKVGFKVTYGFDPGLSKLFLYVADKRLAWKEENTNEFNNICEKVCADGSGRILQLDTHMKLFGPKISVPAMFELMRKYGAKREHLDSLNDDLARCNMERYNLDRCSVGKLCYVEHLARSSLRSEFPSDLETRARFGFCACKDIGEERKLLGLYIGLLERLECSNEALHQAYLDDKIGDLVDSSFSVLPVGSRGGYYPWFDKNRHIVKRSKKESS